MFTPTLLVAYVPRELAQRPRAQFPSDKREACNPYLRQFDNLSADEQTKLPAAGRRLLWLMLDAKPLGLAGTDGPTFCAEPGAALPAKLSLTQQFGMTPLADLQAATVNPARH